MPSRRHGTNPQHIRKGNQVDRGTLVTGGGQSAPVNWRSARGWISLICGASVLALTAAALLLHWPPHPILTNALIAISVSLALITQESRRALLGFTLASGAFLTELFLILLQATAR